MRVTGTILILLIKRGTAQFSKGASTINGSGKADGPVSRFSRADSPARSPKTPAPLRSALGERLAAASISQAMLRPCSCTTNPHSSAARRQESSASERISAQLPPSLPQAKAKSCRVNHEVGRRASAPAAGAFSAHLPGEAGCGQATPLQLNEPPLGAGVAALAGALAAFPLPLGLGDEAAGEPLDRGARPLRHSSDGDGDDLLLTRDTQPWG